MLGQHKSNFSTSSFHPIIQLSSTFQNTFNFPTTTAYLSPHKPLELRNLSQVSSFALTHDRLGDLLIVYYTGYAAVDDVKNFRHKKELHQFDSRDEIVWIESEKVGKRSHLVDIRWPTPPPQSLTPALLKALVVVAKETVEYGKVYMTMDVLKTVKAEMTAVGGGRSPRIVLESLRYNSALEEHIVVEPSGIPIASLGTK
ncbi:MAG: hypothetical protein Q9207_005010 [Kuettlingeria erythrocarpa]